MKFYCFHLMPYAALDPDYDKTHNSAWVTLPNSYYDPKIGHALYNRYLDELEYADELGFDGVGVNEHHQTAYGLMPAPQVLAGALSRRVQRAKIAVHAEDSVRDDQRPAARSSFGEQRRQVLHVVMAVDADVGAAQAAAVDYARMVQLV